MPPNNGSMTNDSTILVLGGTGKTGRRRRVRRQAGTARGRLTG
jgi:hypothetical protein